VRLSMIKLKDYLEFQRCYKKKTITAKYISHGTPLDILLLQLKHTYHFGGRIQIKLSLKQIKLESRKIVTCTSSLRHHMLSIPP